MSLPRPRPYRALRPLTLPFPRPVPLLPHQSWLIKGEREKRYNNKKRDIEDSAQRGFGEANSLSLAYLDAPAEPTAPGPCLPAEDLADNRPSKQQPAIGPHF